MASPFFALIEELRALRGGPKVTYEAGAAAFPTTERVLRLKRGQHLPTFGQAEPDAGRFPNNVLTDQVELGSDPQWVEVYRRYERVPGKPLSMVSYDRESDSLITTTRTTKLLAAITEGIVTTGSGGSATVTVTESQQISDLLGVEVVTVYPRGGAYSEATAILSEDVLPFQFPATIDFDAFIASNGVIGTSRAFVKRVPHLRKTWWEISETKPALTLNGVIDFGVALNLSGDDPLGEVVYNPTDALEWKSMVYDFPGSVPTFTDYMAEWVGGDPRSVAGKVVQDGGKFRWRVEKVFVTFVAPRLPTINNDD